jgi:glycosyltransferase involved in cell wall biosynthesis
MIAEVSIIVPVYNREKLIIATLESVAKQTFENWLCFIIDDGSTDNSQVIIEEFIKNDPRFIFLKRDATRKKGASTCRNMGLEQAKTKYIQFLDSDDLISKNKIEEQMAFLKEEDEYTIAICKWGTFTEEYTLFEELPSYATFPNLPNFLNALTQSKGYFPLHSYLIPKKIIEYSGYWNEHIHLNDDGEFILRLISHAEKIIFAENAIAWYRTNTVGNLSNFNNKLNVKNAILSWKVIECNLLLRFGQGALPFIEWSKARFFINLKKWFPELIAVNSDFFTSQIKEEKSKKRLISRLQKKIKKFGA